MHKNVLLNPLFYLSFTVALYKKKLLYCNFYVFSSLPAFQLFTFISWYTANTPVFHPFLSSLFHIQIYIYLNRSRILSLIPCLGLVFQFCLKSVHSRVFSITTILTSSSIELAVIFSVESITF